HRFASFCWYLPDNDLVKRQNAHVYCNQFPEYKKPRGDWDSTPRDNISRELVDALNEQGEVSQDEIVYYTYAILCSDAFLDAFEGALFTVADPRQKPRIPIVADLELFRNIAQKGKALAELERAAAEIDLPQNLEELQNLYLHEFQLTDYNIDGEEEKIDLLEDGSIVISLTGIPQKILDFTVSGYQVLQQWLKFHSYRYTRIAFTSEQFTNLLKLLHQIRSQISIVEALDEDVSRIVLGEVELI
ncbi:MAG: type ISP restriction/modification enzyme, partial [Anaerolineae bacterium]|nr:type ISP restriction/modification enzyme [Anaerolineae bacterium]